ncbi:MAG: poly-gamma-glutamate system protein [Candidatus Methanomethylicaceae archaeon]
MKIKQNMLSFIKNKKQRLVELLPLRKPARNKKDLYFLTLLAFISIGAFLFSVYNKTIISFDLYTTMLSASNLMAKAIEAIRDYRNENRISFSPDDINLTGLIGLRYSPITTTLGDLGAKRTSTNPNFAALLVYLFNQAGVHEGDAVAIGASGSFPALIIATLAAAQAMKLFPILICSLGASQWGANDPAFTWIEIEYALITKKVFPEHYRAVALSIGGDRDIGLEMPVEGRQLLIKKISSHPGKFIYIDDLQENKNTRIDIYQRYAGTRKITVFVSIGGGWADLGEDPAVLQLKPGLNKIANLPASEKRGVLFEMAAKGIPVIHLLNIRELAFYYGLPWDPSPLPEPGSGYIFTKFTTKPIIPVQILAAIYFIIFIAIIVCWRYKIKIINM